MRSRIHAFARATERSDPHPCGYLPSETATLEFTLAPDLTGAEYESLMEKGYRKFGMQVFRPVCASCSECRAIRVPADDFMPSRSQRRALKKFASLSVETGPVRADSERLDLYARYHEAQAARKGWPLSRKSRRDYVMAYELNPIESVEISVRDQGALVAILIADLTPNAFSAVYHFTDPAPRYDSLGTFVILQSLLLARQMGKRYVYLGYYVAGCGSMAYKNRFLPHEIRGHDDVWIPTRGKDRATKSHS